VTLLARRDFGTVELGAKLVKSGFESDVVQSVITELGERGLIDDRRFVQHFVAYHAGRGQGPLRIQRTLTALGLDDALVESALASGAMDWARRADEVRRQKFGVRLPAAWPEKARQARFLQYRGFSRDHIRSALGADPENDPES
jgi:regulatory protein